MGDIAHPSRRGRVSAPAVALVSALFLTMGSIAMAGSLGGPLELADEGSFFVGGQPAMSSHPGTPAVGAAQPGQITVRQMYVQYRIPKTVSGPPIVMVHGGTRTGTTYTGTPDGRESWAQYFARRGYAVYVVDQPGRGRSGYLTEAYGMQSLADGESGQRRYLQQEKFKLWPQAHLHTQWPGSGAPDDPVTLQMTGSYVPEIKDFTKQQFLNRDALVALLDKIGRASCRERV